MSPPCRVVYSEKVRAHVKAFVKRFIDEGSGEVAIAALKTIDRRLQDDPAQFGDIWYSLPAGTQTVMHRLLPPWSVVYGVHNEKDIVFVRSILPYPS
jgi:hypothetical protein